MAWYENWFDSEYYHLLYAHRDMREADAFIHHLLDYLKPDPASKMLDLACGKGRHTLTLAQRGFEVVGIDLSPSSIAQARKHESDKVSFYTHDMRKPFRKDYFDYVFNFFTSFGYFEREEDHLDTISSVAKCLKKEGCFLLDYLNSPYVAKNLVEYDEVLRDGILFKQSRRIENGYFIKDITVVDGEDSYQFQERVRAFEYIDLQLMIEDAGLVIQEVFGDYDLSPYDEENSSRLILLAQQKS